MTTWFPVKCPTCGYQMDGHSAIGDEDATPDEGDVSVCIACGSIGVYVWMTALGGFILRKPTPDEHESFMRNPTLVAAMVAHRQARATHPDWPRGPLETTA